MFPFPVITNSSTRKGTNCLASKKKVCSYESEFEEREREERGGGGGRELESVGDNEMRMCLQLLHNCKSTVSG